MARQPAVEPGAAKQAPDAMRGGTGWGGRKVSNPVPKSGNPVSSRPRKIANQMYPKDPLYPRA